MRLKLKQACWSNKNNIEVNKNLDCDWTSGLMDFKKSMEFCEYKKGPQFFDKSPENIHREIFEESKDSENIQSYHPKELEKD